MQVIFVEFSKGAIKKASCQLYCSGNPYQGHGGVFCRRYDGVIFDEFKNAVSR